MGFHPALAPIACLLACACSGGGGATRVQPPTGEVLVAGPQTARTDAPTTVVRGIATEPQAGVEVAGIAATSGDGFLSWQAEVPLKVGSNQLEVVQIAESGAREVAATISRERLDWLFSELVTVTAPPDSEQLVAVGLGVGPDDDAYVGTGLDVLTFDLASGTGAGVRSPLPLAAFELAPTVGLFTPLRTGDAAVLRMVGWGRDCQCPLDRLVTIDLATGSDSSIDTPGLLRLASHAVATGRPGELAFSGIDGFGVVGVDGNAPQILARAGGSFRPQALARGVDDSTFLIADARPDVVWRVVRGNPMPEQIAGASIGSGPATGIVRSLAYLADRNQLLTVSGDGLVQIDLTTLERTLLSGEPDLSQVVCTRSRAFVLDDGSPEEIDLSGADPDRTPLLRRGLPAGPDWRNILAMSHHAGTDRVACVLPDGVHWLDLAQNRASRAAVLFGITAPAAVDPAAELVAWTIRPAGSIQVRVADFERAIVDSFEVAGEVLALDFDPNDGKLAALVQAGGGNGAAALFVLEPGAPEGPLVTPLGLLPGIADLRFADGIAWISHTERPSAPPHGLGITLVDVARGVQASFDDPPLLRSRFRALFLDRARDTLGVVGDTRLVTSPRMAPSWREATDGRAPQRGNGPAFLAPRAACALQGREEALVFDLGLGGVIHVDLVTGERSLVAF